MEAINIMQRKIFITLLLYCAGIICLSGSVSAGQQLAALPDVLTITPRIMNINTFFSGGELTISGNILSSEDIILEIRGKDSESSFDMKGRVGPFWMAIGNIKLENIPELYQLLLPEGPDWDRKAEALGLGIDRLKDRLITSGTVDIPLNVFKMFAKLKDHEGLYRQVPNAIRYSPESDGTKRFTAVCLLPDRIKTGTYEIKATTILNGIAERQMKDHFSVNEIGFIKLVNHLALDRRLIYGVSAVIIALMAGLIMGVLFKQSGGTH